jgi:hypothetical protein
MSKYTLRLVTIPLFLFVGVVLNSSVFAQSEGESSLELILAGDLTLYYCEEEAPDPIFPPVWYEDSGVEALLYEGTDIWTESLLEYLSISISGIDALYNVDTIGAALAATSWIYTEGHYSLDYHFVDTDHGSVTATRTIVVEDCSVEGEAPEVEGETPEVEGETPEVEGEAPEVEGETPEVEGEAPEVEGETPEVEGETPEIEGEEAEPVEGEPVVPIEGEPVEPVEGEPVEPSEGEPVEPVEGEPVVPIEGEPVEPVEGEPVEPVEGEPVEPVEGEPVVPIEGEPVVPIEGEPVEPVEGEPVEPVEGEPVVPIEGEPVEPVEGEPVEPVEGEPVEPVEGEAAAVEGESEEEPPVGCTGQEIGFGGLLLVGLTLLSLWIGSLFFDRPWPPVNGNANYYPE